MKSWVAILMLLPALASFVFGFVAPMIIAGRLSLFDSDYLIEQYVGLGNFVEAFRDERFMRSFVNVLIFTAAFVPTTIVMTYGVASMLTRFSDGVQSAGRLLSYIPSLTAGIIIALLWRWLLKREGLINEFIISWGGQGVGWLTQPWTARFSIIIISLSTGPGALIILSSATLKSIPPELHDIAIIDGASESQYRRMIVRPLMMPTILLIALLVIVGTMQAWEMLYVLTGEGGPKGSTATPVYDLFRTAFIYNRPGYAAAKGFILLITIGALIFAKRKAEQWAGADA